MGRRQALGAEKESAPLPCRVDALRRRCQWGGLGRGRAVGGRLWAEARSPGEQCGDRAVRVPPAELLSAGQGPCTPSAIKIMVTVVSECSVCWRTAIFFK